MNFNVLFLFILIAGCVSATDTKMFYSIPPSSNRTLCNEDTFMLSSMLSQRHTKIHINDDADLRDFELLVYSSDSSYFQLVYDLYQIIAENGTQLTGSSFVRQYPDADNIFHIYNSPYGRVCYLLKNKSSQPINVFNSSELEFSKYHLYFLLFGIAINMSSDFLSHSTMFVYLLASTFSLFLTTLLICYFILNRMNVNKRTVALVSTVSSIGITSFITSFLSQTISLYTTDILRRYYQYIFGYAIICIVVGVSLAYYYMPEKNSKLFDIFNYILKGLSIGLLLNSSPSCFFSIMNYIAYIVLTYILKHIVPSLPRYMKELYFRIRYYFPMKRSYLSPEEAAKLTEKTTNESVDDLITTLINIYNTDKEKFGRLSEQTQQEVLRCINDPEYYSSLIANQDREYDKNK